MKDLGYANGWKDTPEIVKECKEKGHEREWRSVGRSVGEYTCKICGYTFRVDSSD